MHEEPSNTLEACVWEASRIVDDVRLQMPFISLMSRVFKRDEANPQYRGRGAQILEKIRGWRNKDNMDDDEGNVKLGFVLRMKGEDLLGDGEKEIIFRGLQEDSEKDDRIVGVGVGALGESGLGRFVQEGEKNWLMRELRETVPEVKILATEVIGMPYQIARVRLNGADALFLLAAVFPKKDLEYVVRMTRKLGMLGIVECHSVEELDAALEIQEVEAVLLGRRDVNSLRGSLEGFEEMFKERREVLRAKNIVVFAEGTEKWVQDRVEGKADALLLVPQPKLDEETLQRMYNAKRQQRAESEQQKKDEAITSR